MRKPPSSRWRYALGRAFVAFTQLARPQTVGDPEGKDPAADHAGTRTQQLHTFWHVCRKGHTYPHSGPEKLHTDPQGCPEKGPNAHTSVPQAQKHQLPGEPSTPLASSNCTDSRDEDAEQGNSNDCGYATSHNRTRFF
jgi:hypothetical protein